MSQEPTIATAVAESGPEVSAADLRAGPTQHLAVEPLREVTTPSVLLTRGSVLTRASVCVQTALRYVWSAHVPRFGP